jgi:hypothetical protein
LFSIRCCAQVLALFSSMDAAVLDTFNTTEADQKLESHLEDLKLLLITQH